MKGNVRNAIHHAVNVMGQIIIIALSADYHEYFIKEYAAIKIVKNALVLMLMIA